jgi:hypothetical protein
MMTSANAATLATRNTLLNFADQLTFQQLIKHSDAGHIQ